MSFSLVIVDKHIDAGLSAKSSAAIRAGESRIGQNGPQGRRLNARDPQLVQADQPGADHRWGFQPAKHRMSRGLADSLLDPFQEARVMRTKNAAAQDYLDIARRQPQAPDAGHRKGDDFIG